MNLWSFAFNEHTFPQVSSKTILKYMGNPIDSIGVTVYSNRCQGREAQSVEEKGEAVGVTIRVWRLSVTITIKLRLLNRR